MAQTFTRSEFYDLVWSKPMTQLAKDFGLSDVALHKVCKKHGIPKPPVGWWAKLAAGKKVSRTALPEAAEGTAETISISSGELRNEPEAIRQSREDARLRASEFNPDAIATTHPIVSRTMATLRKAKADANGLVRCRKGGLIDIEIAKDTIDRVELALNRIVAAAKTQGFSLEKSDERAVFTDSTTSVPFRLKEALRRTKHEPTSAELAKAEKEQKDRERLWARNGWGPAPMSSFDRHWPEWDYMPTGKVTFEFDIYVRHTSSIRRSFKDAKIQRLENMANDIAVGLAVIAEAKSEDRRRDAEWKTRAEENERRRNEQKRIAYVEDRRDKMLETVLAKVEKRDRLRLLCDQIHSELKDSPSPRATEFVAWLGEVVQRSEQSASAKGLEELFDSENIFGDDDDKGFYPSSWGR